MEQNTVFDNSQEAKADAEKPKVSLVPMKIIFDIARIREYGVEKYDEGRIKKCIL